MVKSERQKMIVSIIEECEELSVNELGRRLGRVSSVTVRRDIAELAANGLVKRTHGGVTRCDTQKSRNPSHVGNEDEVAIQTQIGEVDAIVLPPIEGRGADTLRSMARRRRIPFLAESSPQEGGVYIGPDNFAAGRILGNRAGRDLSGQIDAARILLVSLDRLPNTRSRCDGFIKGFTETFEGSIQSWRVDGRGSFRTALNASLDAFRAHPNINIAFGVNDHSTLAAIEASDRCAIGALRGFGVGGEGAPLFDALSNGRKLKACAALFPEVVGSRSIDALAAALSGATLPEEIRTPHVVLTPENLSDYYQRQPVGWSLTPNAEAELKPDVPAPADGLARIIGFVPHYPAHDWYRNMIHAMRQRTEALGYELRIAAPQAGIAREIETRRGVMAGVAVQRIDAGETIVINAGAASLLMAGELARSDVRDVTVVTNSFDVMERLNDVSGIKVIMTSGEYHARHRCLVGPSLGALFETLRVDRAFLSVDGITARFGPSAADERLALAARRFIEASRETVVLADHSIIGLDANHRIAPLASVGEVITDSGSLPAIRLSLTASGTAVTVADEEDDGTQQAGAASAAA